MEPNTFCLLPHKIQLALEKMGFSIPTESQKRAMPAILEGHNVLLVAPTGSGKTEAALLPVFSRFLKDSENKGISILYITPLRALNRDITERLLNWAKYLDLTIDVRHGDTERKVRRRQALNPPNMLVTTPETLQAILPGKLMKKHLENIESVIIDEVHEIAGDKRGVQLSLGLERLHEITGRDFQRIGISATVSNPKEIATFVAGNNRPISIVQVFTPKSYQYSVEYPTPEEPDYELAEKLATSPEAAARIKRILDLISSHSSTLVFVNSRTNAEMIGHKLSLLSDDVSVHHGSLSKEERGTVEDRFKSHDLKAIVCTSTLELGIDVGHVDLVIQYLSPRRVSTLIQRVGRSGHRLDRVSKGVVLTAFTDDTLESTAAVKRAYMNLSEPVVIPENALDVLGHQIAGIILDKRLVKIDKAYEIICRAFPYSKLPRVKFLEVANYLSELREIMVENGFLRGTGRTRRYYYENISMIPDERRYPIIDMISDRRIGTLGDEFMALRARIGLNFIVKGRVWRIVQIEDETGTVYVVPSEDPIAAIPGWDGEMLSVPESLAKEVGRLRHEITVRLKNNRNVEGAIEDLIQKLDIDKQVLADVLKEIEEQLQQGSPVPTDETILVEGFGKFLIIHNCSGEIANWTLGCVLDTILSNNEFITGWWNDGYRILIETPRPVQSHDLIRFQKSVLDLQDEEIEKAFNEYLESHFPFAYKMKSIAERFGVLTRGKTMGPQRLAKLPAHFKNTPIYEETIREAMAEKADLRSVKELVTKIKTGKIRILTFLSKENPSPMAYHILEKYAEIPELMAPSHVILSNIQKMEKSIESKRVKILCFSCLEWILETKVRDLTDKPSCEKCGSGLLTSLKRHQDVESLTKIVRRRLDGESLAEEETKELAYSRRVADLVLSYGKRAIIALQVKGVGPETAFRILGKMTINDDEFYLDLLKAKIQFLRTRQYWNDKDNTSS